MNTYLLYYRGNGYGIMSGVKEYMVFINTTVTPRDIDANCCAGYQHLATLEVFGNTVLLPMYTILVPRL